ncbi:hypothetical protein [Nostoc sp.]|uniref:hypothetical protein n=1 Tax=Nostoc sp. TaxID=1180 RepID=UPI002FFA013A
MAWEPPFGFTSRLRRETPLQRWIHRNALPLFCDGSRSWGRPRQMLQVGGAAQRTGSPTHWLPQDRAASPLRFVKKIDFDKEF